MKILKKKIIIFSKLWRFYDFGFKIFGKKSDYFSVFLDFFKLIF